MNKVAKPVEDIAVNKVAAKAIEIEKKAEDVFRKSTNKRLGKKIYRLIGFLEESNSLIAYSRLVGVFSKKELMNFFSDFAVNEKNLLSRIDELNNIIKNYITQNNKYIENNESLNKQIDTLNIYIEENKKKI